MPLRSFPRSQSSCQWNQRKDKGREKRREVDKTFYSLWTNLFHACTPNLQVQATYPNPSLRLGLDIQKGMMGRHESRLHFPKRGLVSPLPSHFHLKYTLPMRSEPIVKADKERLSSRLKRL